MVREVKEHWEKQVNETNEIVAGTLIFPAFISLLGKAFLIYTGMMSVYDDPYHVIVGFGASGLIIFLRFKKSISTSVRAFLIYVLLEVINYSYWGMANYTTEDHNNLYVIGASFYVLHMQSELLNKPCYSLLLVTKHLGQWYFYKLYISEMSVYQGLGPIFSCLMLVICYYSYLSNKKDHEIKMLIYKNQLEKTQNEMKLLLRLFPNCIAVLDSDLNPQMVNENMLKTLECNTHNLMQSLYDLEYDSRYTNNSGTLTGDIRSSLQLQENEEKTLGIVNINSRRFEWSVKRIIMNEESSIIIRANDVTAITILEQTETANRCKSEILRSVSHELRTPANAIHLLTDEIMKNEVGDLHQETQEKLLKVKVSSRLLVSIVNDLVDFCQLMSNLFVLKKQEFQLKPFMEEFVKFASIQAKQKNLRLRFRYDELLPEAAYTDPSRLSQVLQCLVSNSLKYTQEGSIEICALLSSENQLKVHVRDTGIGIDSQKLEMLDDLFSDRNSHLYKSNHVGLQIANLLTKRLGRKIIQIESQEGRGSTFSFVCDILKEVSDVPDCSGSSTEMLPELSSSIVVRELTTAIGQEATQPSVLIVDDNDFNREILFEILSKTKLKCLKARDGLEALEIVQRQDSKGHPFRVILMDCNMPRLDGWEATRRINYLSGEGRLSTSPKIVGYTAYNSEEDIRQCYESGMCDHIIKPAPADLIIQTLKRYLDN